ncbi:hypothetical protein LXL04_029824 [Taraxacum kok-saghyz]
MDSPSAEADSSASGGVFKVGAEIEVNGYEGDNNLCFYVAAVSRLYQRSADIIFRYLKTGNGEPLLDRVPLQLLRPKPGVFTYDYKCGDAVEIWENERW